MSRQPQIAPEHKKLYLLAHLIANHFGGDREEELYREWFGDVYSDKPYPVAYAAPARFLGHCGAYDTADPQYIDCAFFWMFWLQQSIKEWKKLFSLFISTSEIFELDNLD